MNGQEIDDRPQERESEVRHAHAVAASRHGRASAPGYLGLPSDEDPAGAGAGASEETSEQEADRSRKQSAGNARGRERSGSGQRSQQRSAGARRTSKATRSTGGSSARKRTTAGKGTTAAKRAVTGKGAATSKGPKRHNSSKGASSAGGSRRTSGAGRASGSGGTGRGVKQTPSNRTSSSGGANRGTSKRTSGRAMPAASSVKSKIASAGESGTKVVGKRARRAAVGGGGSLLTRLLIMGSRAAAHALADKGAKGLDGLLEKVRRLPIQQSIDVAVPPEIAWAQWMELKHLPEGTQRLSNVQREGDELRARIDGARGSDWSAEIIDEREQESFAWQSTQGSDSAGLATFHPLGERLTRIELTLDVQPEDLSEAARLLLHIADRRVGQELRRFKADAELLNPDVYEELLTAEADNNGSDGEEETK